MRKLVMFTIAGSDKQITVDANRVEAVSEDFGGKDTTVIHAWGGSIFMVEGSAGWVMDMLWGPANTAPGS